MNSRPGLRDSTIDLLLVGGLLVVAVAVRLPYLQLVPVITDEAFEVLAALSVSQGRWIVFGPVDPTTGPLITYLLALTFRLFGPGVYLPRIVILALGALTVGVAYQLGRLFGGRWAGWMAGALLAFSPIHVIVNSHIAWSNSATPLFAALTFTTLHLAVGRKNGGLLVLAGFLYGLALQTHISMAAVLPGLLVWFLAQREARTWLRQPWPYLAVAAALLGYGNMIAYHLTSEGGGLAEFQKHDYAWVSQPSWATYWTNLKMMMAALAETIGGQVPRLDSPPLSEVVAGLLLVWCIASLAYATWRGEGMPLLVLLSTALTMPYFNKRYEGLLSQRYTAFLLPLIYAAMGMALAQAVDVWRRKRQRLFRALIIASVVLALLLALFPLSNTLRYFAVETRAGRDNILTLAMTRFLRENLPPHTPLYLSSNLKGQARGDGGYRYLRALYYYLTLEGVPHEVLDFPDLRSRLQTAPDQETWLVLAADDCHRLAAEFPLEPIEASPSVINEGCLVRYQPSNATP